MATRVALFIDYQNVYKRAREAFGLRDEWHGRGQVRPLALGLVVRGPKDGGRELVAVHCYRGLPSSKYDARAYSASQRQIASWRLSGDIVHPHTRPLNYRDPRQPREKGIDVALAVDFVIGFQRGDFDVGVIFSDDTDLHPALEAVGVLGGPGHAELATWYQHGRGPRQVMSGGDRVPTIVLDSTKFGYVEDETDYTKPTPRKPRPPRK